MSLSLGRRMLVALGVVAALGVALDLVLWRVLEVRLRAEAVRQARTIAELLAGEAAIVLQQPERDLDRAIARLDAGEDVAGLDRYLRDGSLIEQIVVLDRRHAVIGVLPPDPDLVGLDWSRQPFVGSQRAWSDTFLSPDRHEPGVMLHAPWSGGTVAFRVALSRLGGLAAVVEMPPGGFAAIVDRRGVVIGHGDAGLARRRESMRDLAQGLTTAGGVVHGQGGEGLLTGAAIPGTGWTVLLFQPVEQVFGQARQAALLPSVVLLAMLALVAGIFLVIRHQLVRALARFAELTRGIAAGETVAVGDQPAELRPLAASFTAMASAVRDRTAELERSRAAYRDLVEGVEAVILRLDPQGLVVYVNPAGERLFGWSAAELVGKPVVGTLLPGTDATGQSLAGLIERAVSDPESMRSHQNENRTRDGRRLWMAWSNRPETDDQGRVTGLFCVGTDLTEQNRQERAFQAVVEAMVIAGGEAVFEAVAASLERWLGCDLALVIRLVDGRPRVLARRGLAIAGDLDLAGTPCEAVLREGWLAVEDGLGDRYPACPLVVSQHLRSFLGIAVPGGRGVIACLWRGACTPPPRCRQVFDLLARRVASEFDAEDLRTRLAHAQRLDALGQLAGGVAHDFNNQLAVVLASAELLRPRLSDQGQVRFVDGILKAAERAKALTTRLLAFARRGSIEQAPFDLHAVVTETVQLAERTLGSQVILVSELAAERCTVLGNASLVQNALVNLAVNARDAMPGGGALRFATRLDGERIELAVSDTGCGMSPEVQARIFEPFFTTKPVGKGNGLGLAAVYGTVTGMHGTIAVRSAPGAGTTFTITLPLCESGAAPVDEAVRVGCILVADDEPELRQQVADHLRSLGHAVVEVGDGQDVVDRIAAEPKRYDAVLLDGRMPRLTGWQAYQRIRELAPGVGAVVLTGYGSADDLDGFRTAGVPILLKPCPLDRVAQALAQVLRRR